jgi:hypothetical protein
MKLALLRSGMIENPLENEDRYAGRRAWIIENAGEPHSGLASPNVATWARISSAVTLDETLDRLRTPSVSRRLRPSASESW